jgi:hypothetical protein
MDVETRNLRKFAVLNQSQNLSLKTVRTLVLVLFITNHIAAALVQCIGMTIKLMDSSKIFVAFTVARK